MDQLIVGGIQCHGQYPRILNPGPKGKTRDQLLVFWFFRQESGTLQQRIDKGRTDRGIRGGQRAVLRIGGCQHLAHGLLLDQTAHQCRV